MNDGWQERVRALREALGTIEAVAAELGVGYVSVYRWISGRARPSRLAVAKIEALEAKISERKGGKA